MVSFNQRIITIYFLFTGYYNYSQWFCYSNLMIVSICALNILNRWGSAFSLRSWICLSNSLTFVRFQYYYYYGLLLGVVDLIVYFKEDFIPPL